MFGIVKGLATILVVFSVLEANAGTTDGMYGFTKAEIEKVRGGAILSKELKETSDKELAGVVAIFIRKPVAELADFLLEGKLLEQDKSVRDLHVWKPDESVDKAFENRAELKTRYEAYRKNGLKGAGKPGEELELAIKSILPAQRWAEYSKALLNFSTDVKAGLEYRFFCYQQEVDGRPTFILSHRAGQRGEHAALITEQRYYVSRTYDCRFIASDCVEAPGGTLLFYVNCIFTDQVTGLGSSLKHSIGRRRMLADVATNLKQVREQLQK